MFRACVPLKLSPTETIENTIETPQSQINFKNSNNHPTWKRHVRGSQESEKRVHGGNLEDFSPWQTMGYEGCNFLKANKFLAKARIAMCRKKARSKNIN